MVVSHFIDQEEDAEIGLFHLPGTEDSDKGSLILQTGDLIPQTDTPIVNFGLVDIDDDGEYVAQVEGDVPNRKGRLPRRPGPDTAEGDAEPIRRGSRRRPPSTALVRGNVRAQAGRSTVAAASRRMVEAEAPVRGECIFGPRVSDEDTACTIHRNDKVQVLTLNGRPIARSDHHSPLGDRIRAVSAPVLSPDGVVFFVLVTGDGIELCMSNGLREQTILSRGDRIEGLPVNTILHAFHSQQADKAGRIVFTAEYEGRPNAIVVGIPV
jgi:hypothetical protein